MTEVLDLTLQDYDLIRRLVYAHSGINLGEHKTQLVRARLGKLVRQGGFISFRDYFHHVERDASGEALCQLLDSISTNTTHLFREIRHFNLLGKILRDWLEGSPSRTRTIRIWSAGCSSGEEPHSIAMVAHDIVSQHPSVDLKILATDLSVRVLSRAKLGVYDPHRVGTVPPDLRSRYLEHVEIEGQSMLQLVPELRKLITFSRFNLMTPTFPFRQGFDIIFCRNVMIYFDRPTQQTLVSKFSGQLHEGGYLLIGHSESLNGIDHGLSYVEPTVYRKG